MFQAKPPAMPGQHDFTHPAAGLPDSIEGLDLPLLRERLGSGDELIALILRQFQSDFTNWPAEFDAALAAQDRATMIRMAHTLKGTALNIAAPRLHTGALQLEMALREGRDEQHALLQDCRQDLQDLLQALERLNGIGPY